MVLSQTWLIERILSVMNMTDYNLKYTPADKIPVGNELEGDPCLEDWKYRLVVGMMLYLAGSTRPDVSFTVHQCISFSHNLRRTHEIALKHIVRNLQGSKDKGFIFSPDHNKFQPDLYADADFASLFVVEDKQDPVSVKSWTGLLMNFGGVPIFGARSFKRELLYPRWKQNILRFLRR